MASPTQIPGELHAPQRWQRMALPDQTPLNCESRVKSIVLVVVESIDLCLGSGQTCRMLLRKTTKNSNCA